jgi:hypothetical protein
VAGRQGDREAGRQGGIKTGTPQKNTCYRQSCLQPPNLPPYIYADTRTFWRSAAQVTCLCNEQVSILLIQSAGPGPEGWLPTDESRIYCLIRLTFP